MRRRVVITGIGCTTGLGTDTESVWDGLVSGRSGLRPIDRFDPAPFPTDLGAGVPEFDIRKVVPKGYRKSTKVMARDIELAVLCAQLAARDAGLLTRGSGEGDFAVGSEAYALEGPRLGCQIGAGLIAADMAETARALATSTDDSGSFSWREWGTEDGGKGAMNNLPPLWMLKYLPNMLACHVTIVHGAEGPSNTIMAAEASGLLSLGESSRVVERGDADACFSGGAESKLNMAGLMRVLLANRLAETKGSGETDGGRVVRPYDPESRGSLIGEASGILMVEGADHAAERGKRAYCEIAGFGAAQAAAAPFPGVFDEAPEIDWSGGLAGLPPEASLTRAIRAALSDAGIGPEDVDAIVPGAMGVELLDAMEAGALRDAFGDRLGSIPLVTVTPQFGLCNAGHGAAQAAVGALCVREQRLPARLHAGTPVAGLDAGAAASREAKLGNVLVCVHSLGGQSAALVLRRV